MADLENTSKSSREQADLHRQFAKFDAIDKEDFSIKDLKEYAPFLPKFFAGGPFYSSYAVLKVGYLLSRDESAKDVIAPWFSSEDAKIRACAAHVVGYGKKNGEYFIPEIMKCLSDDDEKVRERALQAMSRLDLPLPKNLATKILNDPSDSVRKVASELPEGYSLKESILSKDLPKFTPMSIEWINIVEEMVQSGSDMSGVVPTLKEVIENGDLRDTWIATSLLHQAMPSKELKDNLDKLTVSLTVMVLKPDYYQDFERVDSDEILKRMNVLTSLCEHLSEFKIWHPKIIDALLDVTLSHTPEMIESAILILETMPDEHEEDRLRALVKAGTAAGESLVDQSLDNEGRHLADRNAADCFSLLARYLGGELAYKYGASVFEHMTDKEQRRRVQKLLDKYDKGY